MFNRKGNRARTHFFACALYWIISLSCNLLFDPSIDCLSKQTTILDFESHDGKALNCRPKSCHWDVAGWRLEAVCVSSYAMHLGHDRSTLE